MKEKFLENLNAMVYAFVGFVTLFLLGCPSLISNNVAGLSTFVDSFGLFNYASYCVGVNLQWSTSIFSNIGALAAAGVFNIFVLISALLLFAIGVLTLLKKAKIFDWKLDEKIGN
ncbi:MAG: hypothetical protein PHE93_01970, partial [Clostridia bacterium]|nr:hypothetical protein [Clostridia bacterium]